MSADGGKSGRSRSRSRQDLDPDVLEELEFWGDPTEPDDGTDADGRAWGDDRTPGALVLVGTPIGNLGDLSPRAVETLQSADVIYCEDTRHSRKLLTHAGITGVRLRSLHDHNEDDRVAEVLMPWVKAAPSLWSVTPACPVSPTREAGWWLPRREKASPCPWSPDHRRPSPPW